jgi:hypothetical protein
MYVGSGFDSACPDCLAEIYELQAMKPPSYTYSGCGLTYEGHRHMEQVRRQAEEDARQLILEAREEAEYSRVLQQAVHDELDRRAKKAHG